MNPEIAAVICTRNRSASLRAALDTLTDQTLKPHRYEILIVDNGSTDDTRRVVEGTYRDAPQAIRYIYEERLGLSTARNRALAETAADVIAFMDDDALADKEWLAALLAVYEREPDAMCVGGKINLGWPYQYPPWLPDELLDYLGHFDYATGITKLHYPRYPVGTNISFRKDVFEQIGLFSEHYGRKGSSLLSNEELEICYRIERHGYGIFYTPEAIVTHVVAPERLSRSWFLRRAYWQGRSSARFERSHLSDQQKRRSEKPVATRALSRIWHLSPFRLLFEFVYRVGYLREQIYASADR